MWHLNTLPQSSRLSGLALRHSIAQVLSHCPTPPRSVVHDEYPDENLGLPVDGLARLTLDHGSSTMGPRRVASPSRLPNGCAPAEDRDEDTQPE